MTYDQHVAKLAEYELTPFENQARTEYFSKYLVLGETKGKAGTANVVFAQSKVAELFQNLPHLLHKYDDPLANAFRMDGGLSSTKGNSMTATTKSGASKASSATTKGTAKATAKAKTKVATKSYDYKDGTIFFRADRNKYAVMIGGKQPCARNTVEQCKAWMKKKFPKVKATVLKVELKAAA